MQRLIYTIILCLAFSVGTKFFLTGSLSPNFAPFYNDKDNQDLDLLEETYWETFFKQRVVLSPVSKTIIELGLFDLDQSQVWQSLAVAQNLTEFLVHKVIVSKGQLPRKYNVTIVVRSIGT